MVLLKLNKKSSGVVIQRMNKSLKKFIDLNCPNMNPNSEKLTYILIEEINKLKIKKREEQTY